MSGREELHEVTVTPNRITRPTGRGSETPIGYGLDLLAIRGDQMGEREKMSRRVPYLARQLSVSRPGGLDPN